ALGCPVSSLRHSHTQLVRSKEAGVGESGDLVFLRLREQLEENPLPFGRGRGIKGCDACSLDLFHIKVQDDGCVISGSAYCGPRSVLGVILDNQRDWGRSPAPACTPEPPHLVNLGFSLATGDHDLESV